MRALSIWIIAILVVGYFIVMGLLISDVFSILGESVDTFNKSMNELEERYDHVN